MFICNIHKYINIDTTKMLLCTLVVSQLHYVNSILSRAPTTMVKPYQTTQNIAVRIAYKKWREDVYTYLKELHWLPMKYRKKFKLLTVVYNALQGQAPQYHKEKVKHKHFLEPLDNQHHPTLLWTSFQQEKIICWQGL